MSDLEQLDAEVTRLTRERDDLRRLTRNHLPVLDNVRVASPCLENWATMAGDARTRHCGRCKQNVYDLSELTRGEAESLLREKEGKLCVRFYRRAHDNTILTRDCPDRTRRRRRGWLGLGAGFAALIALIVGWFVQRPRDGYMMGSVGSVDGWERPATLADVIYERYEDAPAQSAVQETAQILRR